MLNPGAPAASRLAPPAIAPAAQNVRRLPAIEVCGWAALLCLLAIRLPSLVEPAGADQGLYAYVGERILDGWIPYRDAWDQKPPAVHCAYALLLRAWPDLRVVNLADLAVTALVSLQLVALSSALTGS